MLDVRLIALALATCSALGCVTSEPVPARGLPAVSLLGMRGEGEPEFSFAIDDDTLTSVHLRLALGKEHSAGLAASFERQEGEVPTGASTLITESSDYAIAAAFIGGEGRHLRLPFEIGVAFAEYSALDRTTSRGIEWDAVGLRGNLESEVILLYGHDFEVSLFGGLTGTIGVGDVTIRSTVNQEGELTWTQYGWEYGARLQIGPVVGGIAMVSRRQKLSEDPENVIFDQEQGFEGLMITGGVRF